MLPFRPADTPRRLIRALRPWDSNVGLVRVGSEADGGYLIPDDLTGLVGCLSPGVAGNVSFDLALAERGIDIFMADHSVPRPPVHHPRFHFTRKFLDTYNSRQTVRIDDWCSGLKEREGDLLLEMDIEGAEFAVVGDMSDDLLRRFRIMVVEIHDLDRIFDVSGRRILRRLMAKLCRHHRIVHIHPNNYVPAVSEGRIEVPPVMEFTFHRKDRARFSRTAGRPFPHELDRDNDPMRASIVLPEYWR